MNNTNAALVLVILFLICGLSAIGRTLAMARREKKLDRQGTLIRGRIIDIRFRGYRAGKAYGVVTFRYEHQGMTYRKQQKVHETTARSLLQQSREIDVCYLSSWPSLAKLADFSDVISIQQGWIIATFCFALSACGVVAWLSNQELISDSLEILLLVALTIFLLLFAVISSSMRN